MTEDQPWYAVRCVLVQTDDSPWAGELPDGTFSHEERITLWLATSSADAIAKAEHEVREYTEGIGLEYTGFAQAYHLFEDPSDGREVFSLIRDSELVQDEYLDTFFATGRERQGDAEGTRP